MVKGRAAIGAMWKGMAEHVSNPKVTTLDVKRLSPRAAREIGTFSLMTKDPTPKEISGKYLVVYVRADSTNSASARASLQAECSRQAAKRFASKPQRRAYIKHCMAAVDSYVKEPPFIEPL